MSKLTSGLFFVVFVECILLICCLATSTQVNAFSDNVNTYHTYSDRQSKEPSRVVVLNEENFNKYVGQPDKYTFVLYCTKWARDCKELESLWDVLSIKQSKGRHRDVFTAAKVDGDKSMSLVKRMNITAFPTMMYYTPLEPEGLEYNSVREVYLLESFIFQFTETSAQ